MDYNKVFNDELLPLKDKIFRFSLSIVRNRDMAEDITQEIYLKLWKNREKWEEWSNLEAITMTMTKNLCLDKLKLKANNTLAIPEGFEKKDYRRTPEEVTEMDDMKAIMRREIANLNDKYRMVLELRDIEGYKYAEIAEILDISMSQVKVTLHRARIELKEAVLNILKSERN